MSGPAPELRAPIVLALGWYGVVALVLLALASVPFTRLVAPAWGMALSGVLWLALVGLGEAARRRSPGLVWLVVLGAVPAYLGFLALGGALAGWAA